MFEAFRCKTPFATTAEGPSRAPSATVAATDASIKQPLKRRRLDGSSAAAAPLPDQLPLLDNVSPASCWRPQQASCDAAAAAGAGSAQEQKPQAACLPAASPSAADSAAGAGRAVGLAPEKMGDAPLRLVIVGHNPSQAAWDKGHFYANPSNWMWRILRDTGLAPAAAIRGAEDDGKMPVVAGVGFTDVGSGTPGTDSSQFTSAHFAAWRPAFFARLAAQAARASTRVPGCACGACGAPLVVAFSGKRQFVVLFPRAAGGGRRAGAHKAAAAAAAAGGEREEGPDAACAGCGSSGGQLVREPTIQARRPGSVATGRQWVLPEGWPLPLSTEVWVMSSTSGAAPMTREARYAPWQALAERLAREPWPRRCKARCGGGAGGCGVCGQGGADSDAGSGGGGGGTDGLDRGGL